MDGRGIAAALALGAAGVSLGTRFLGAREAGIADAYRQALVAADQYGTVVTDAVTGRPARWINNRIVAALVAADAGTLGWGTQAAFLADVRMEAARQNAIDLLPMLAGQAAALVGEPAPQPRSWRCWSSRRAPPGAADPARRGAVLRTSGRRDSAHPAAASMGRCRQLRTLFG